MMDNTQKPVQKFNVALVVVAFIVASAFLLVSDFNQQPKAKLEDLIEGTAHRPYVGRRLIPWILGMAAPPTTEQENISSSEQSKLAAGIRFLLDWLTLPPAYDNVLILFFILNYGALLGFGWTFWRLARHFHLPHPERLTILALLFLLHPVFLSHGYVYDYPTLFLWTWFLLALARKQLGLSLGIVALAILNKETALLMPLVWLSYGWQQVTAKRYWSVLVAQSAIVFAGWSIITWLYRHNEGGLFEFNLAIHLAQYGSEPLVPAVLLVGIFLLLAMAWPIAPPLLKSCALLLLPLSGLYLLFGWPYEFRVFYEVYAPLVLFAGFAMQRILVVRKFAQNNKRQRSLTESAPATLKLTGIEQPQLRRLFLLGTILLAFFLRVWNLDVLPPGILPSEAFNGWVAQQFSADTPFTLFLRGDGTLAPLFVAWQSLAIEGLGASAYSLRLVAVWIGTLTVAVVFALAHVVLDDIIALLFPEVAGDRSTLRTKSATFATISALALAVSFWHVSLSRLGIQAVLSPLWVAVGVLFFMRARRSRRRADWLFAGIALGLNAYADATTAMISCALLIFLIVELWVFNIRASMAKVRTLLSGTGLMAVVVVVMFLPVWNTLFQPSGLVNGDFAEESVLTAPYAAMPGSPRERLGKNLDHVINAFYFDGSTDPSYNLPGRSLHDPLLAFLFTIGLIASLWRMDSPGFRLVLFWFVLTLMATGLAVNAPNYLKMSGVAPSLAVLYGIGAMLLMRLRDDFFPFKKHLTLVIGSGLFIVSGGITFYDYQFRWPQTVALSEIFDKQRYAAAAYVQHYLSDSEARSILLSTELFQSPAMRFFEGREPFRLAQADIDTVEGQPTHVYTGAWLTRSWEALSGPLVLLTVQGTQKFAEQFQGIRSSSSQFFQKVPSAAVDGYGTGDEVSPAQSFLAGEGSVRLEKFRVPHEINVEFENGLELVGYESPIPSTFCPAYGDRVELVTYWRRLSTSPSIMPDSLAFAHWMAPNRQVQANGELGNGYPPRFWRPGEIIQDRRTFAVDFVPEAGKAYFEIGLYRRDITGTYHRFPVVRSSIQTEGDVVKFHPTFVCKDIPTIPAEEVERHEHTIFAHQIELIGVSIDELSSADNALRVHLVWRALGWVGSDYTAFVHLIDRQGQIVSQVDRPPGGAEYPTTLWTPGEMIASQFELPLPSEIEFTNGPALSAYRLRIGLYNLPSGRQLEIVSPAERAGDTFVILPIQ